MRKLYLLLTLLMVAPVARAATNSVAITGGYTKTQTVLRVPTAEMTKVPAPADYGAYPATFFNKTFYTNPTTADLNYEIVTVVGKNSTTGVTVTRAQGGTTAKAVPTNSTWNMQLRFATGFDTATPTPTAVPPTATFTPTNTFTPTATSTATSAFVPYFGATRDVELGSNTITASGGASFGGYSYFADIRRGSNNNFFNIAFEGDSMTSGYPTTQAIGDRISPVTFFGYPANKFNFGSAGKNLRWLVDNPIGSVNVGLSPYAGLHIFVLWFGTNDVWQHTDPGLMESYYRAVCNHARQAGYNKIIACTLQSCYHNDGETTEAVRLDFNARIRANWADFADALADFGGNVTIGASGAATNTNYFQLDLIHMTVEGYNIVAGYMDTAIAQVLRDAQVGGLHMPQRGTTAPTPVPRYPGDMYVDSTGATIYIGTCTNSVTCWQAK